MYKNFIFLFTMFTYSQNKQKSYVPLDKRSERPLIAFIIMKRVESLRIIYNYPPKGRWIVVDIYRDAKRRGIYPLLFTNPEGDSCFSIYQIRWTKKNAASLMATISSETFAKQRTIFLSVRKTVNVQGYSELREPIKTRENCYPLIW